ncbi:MULTISPECIES: YqcC family protein [unclassified Lonepinella]|uniref:YqcC family protein n=1 Tax=unclassified Lonepinella TaxID=2642006 RepID=UPI0036D935FD
MAQLLHHKTKTHLRDLQKILQELDLWQTVPPSEQAFASQEPFAIDYMQAHEWLQWIFIPRMWALLEAGAALPSKIAISPYVEEALKEQERLSELLRPIIEIEKLLTQC